MLATRMLPELEKQAKEKKAELAKARKPERDSRGHFKPLAGSSAKNEHPAKKDNSNYSGAKAGEMFGVSGSTVQKAKNPLPTQMLGHSHVSPALPTERPALP